MPQSLRDICQSTFPYRARGKKNMLECPLNKIIRRKEYKIEDKEKKKSERAAVEAEVELRVCNRWNSFLSVKEMRSIVGSSYSVHRNEDMSP